METPDWLEPTVEQSPPSSVTTSISPSEARLALQNIEYQSVFETVLDRTCNGHLLVDILEDSHRSIDISSFNKWMMSDKERKSRFRESKRIGSSLMEDDLIRVAKGILMPEADTDRSKLIVETMWKVMKVNDRERYGDDKSIGSGSGGPITINIGSVENPYASPPNNTNNPNIIDITPTISAI